MSQSSRIGAHGTIRVALAGLRFGRQVTAPAIASDPGSRIVAACGRNLERTRAAAAGLGEVSCHVDFEEMLDEARPDAVAIVTPVDLHLDMARAAFDRGVAVLLEKPVAANGGDAERILAAARTANVLNAIDFELRRHPTLLELRRLITTGEIGDVEAIDLMWTSGFWRTPESRTWTWLCDRNRGGGLTLALGSHLVDLARFLVAPVTVIESATIETRVPQRRTEPGELRDVTSDDYATFRGRLENGATAKFTVSGVEDDDRGVVVRVRGTKGEAMATPFEKSSVEIDGAHHRPSGISSDEGIPLDGCVAQLYRDFADTLRRGETTFSPSVADGVVAQHVLDAVRTSAASGESATCSKTP